MALTCEDVQLSCSGRYLPGRNERLTAPVCLSSSQKVHKHCTTGLRPNYRQKHGSQHQIGLRRHAGSLHFPTLDLQPSDTPMPHNSHSLRTQMGYSDLVPHRVVGLWLLGLGRDQLGSRSFRCSLEQAGPLGRGTGSCHLPELASVKTKPWLVWFEQNMNKNTA